MDTHQVRNTRFWKDFFRMYRSMPELWLTTAKEYRNRKLKAKSYEQLLQHMRTSDPNINIHMLKRKINNLRTSYRRELRKVLDNKASLERGDFERGSDDDYKPSLWYYNELEFLHDLETSETPITIQPEPEHYQERTEIVTDDMDDNVVEVTLEEPEPDEDIFAEPYQPGEDMLVMEGEGDNEVDGDADVDNESIVDGDGDGDGVGVGVAVSEQEHATLNEMRHKSDIKMESKYQPQQQHSSNNSINNNNHNNNNSSARHTRIHPYGIAQTRQHQQQQQQQQYHHRQQQQQQQHQRRINAVQQMRRRRQSSTNDADVDGDSYVDIDIDEERSIAAAGKKRRRQQQQMMSSSSLEQQHTEQTESECDLIGKRMAAHFRNMRPDQRLFAERIISEVLVFGRMNRLSLSARFLPNGGGGGVGDVYARVDGK